MHIQKRCRSIYYRAEKINCRHAPPVMITLQMHWALIVFITQLLVSQLVTSLWFPAVLVVAARCVFPRGSGVLAVQIQTLNSRMCVEEHGTTLKTHPAPRYVLMELVSSLSRLVNTFQHKCPYAQPRRDIFYFFVLSVIRFPVKSLNHMWRVLQLILIT